MHIKIEMVPRSFKTSSKPLMNYSGHEASKHFLGWKRSHADFPIFTCLCLFFFFFTVIRRSFLWFHFHTYADWLHCYYAASSAVQAKWNAIMGSDVRSKLDFCLWNRYFERRSHIFWNVEEEHKKSIRKVHSCRFFEISILKALHILKGESCDLWYGPL